MQGHQVVRETLSTQHVARAAWIRTGVRLVGGKFEDVKVHMGTKGPLGRIPLEALLALQGRI